MFYRKTKDGENRTTNHWLKRPVKQVYKIVIITALLAGLSVNAGFATEKINSDLHTIYHIYSEDEYIGVLSDDQKLEQLKENTIENAASEFENLPLTIGTDFSIIPERVFAVQNDDAPVLEKIESLFSIEAEAIGLTIDDELALYVKDMEAYEQLVRLLKLQSVSEKELTEFEARQATTTAIPPLKDNETRVIDIQLSGKLEAVEGQTVPEEVYNAEQALELLKKGKQVEKPYTIKKGDVFEKIAAKHHMKVSELLELNPNYTVDTLLQIGKELTVTYMEPYVEVDVLYESKKLETIQHQTITEKDSSRLKGETTIKRRGSDGKKAVTERIRKRNGQVVGHAVEQVETLVAAVDEVKVVGTKVIASRGTGTFKWPAVGGYISSHMGTRWGRMHQGIDIARPSSYSILASDNGVVTTAGGHSTYGNRIVIKHNNGYETLYAHLSSIDVRVGQTVQQGQKIGVMGSTGRSTGVHLHFEVFKNGANINPMSVLN
ncbi:M23 family metallopeptidase [Sporosarcina sp. HYO08]|uniref:M23 family metallopeptidase n=1 Tax=Sporosarcina sp. HYO08 TaxID=1759557 RepID=UPI000794DF7A|nr:M23 family metallopeptidase [Sporosarcina sp. HYO08]KXH80599.1 hypothetical protein AU377_07580 [Sporosarcina sp. HYO08]